MENTPTPTQEFYVALADAALTVQYGEELTSETLDAEQHRFLHNLLAQLPGKVFDLELRKKIGLWLYRELPIKPEKDSAEILFAITQRELWSDVPWEYLFDGSSFLLQDRGARFFWSPYYQQISTEQINADALRNNIPSFGKGVSPRELSSLGSSKIVLVSQNSTALASYPGFAQVVNGLPGFHSLLAQSPENVRNALRGIAPDIVLLDSSCSSYMVSEAQKMAMSPSVPAAVPAPQAVETKIEWHAASATYLFEKSDIPLIVAASNDAFAWEALQSGVESAILAARYPLPDDEFYLFASELLRSLDRERQASELFDDVVPRWQSQQYTRYASMSPTGEVVLPIPLFFTQKRRKLAGVENDYGVEAAIIEPINEPIVEQEAESNQLHKNKNPAQNFQPATKQAQPSDPVSQSVEKEFSNTASDQHVNRAALAGKNQRSPSLSTANALSSYRSDVAAEVDKLGVKSDVENLCQVMMAKKWKPPLSIGLFGDWGSGKSSFINLMKQMVDATAYRSSKQADSAFVSNVIQIDFNAWHYLDANLWPNLVIRILDGIHEGIVEKPEIDSEAEEYQQLLSSLHMLKDEVAKADERRRVIEGQLQTIDTQIQDKKADQETARGKLETLRNIILESDNAISEDVYGIKAYLSDAIKKLNLHDNSNFTQAWQQAKKFNAFGARLAEAWRLTSADRLLWWALPLVIAFGVWGATLNFPSLNELLSDALTALSALAAVVVSWTKSMGEPMARINKGLDALDTARKKIDETKALWLAAKQKELAELENTRFNALNELQALSDKKNQVEKEKLFLFEKIDALKRGQGLEEFLLRRSNSEDYRAQLGIVALVHQDMKALQAKLKRGIDVRTDQGIQTRHYDRVVLYIDDLDRCSPTRVVEVLQAVHLLLSIPLFVVVVAADSRWLLQCLTTHFNSLLHFPEGLEKSEWGITPQNYLEKIFQIPYTLPPMISREFSTYVADLFAGDIADEITQKSNIEAMQQELNQLQEKQLLQALAPAKTETPLNVEALSEKPKVQDTPAMELPSVKLEQSGVEAKISAPGTPAAPTDAEQRMQALKNEMAQARSQLKQQQLSRLESLPTFGITPKNLNTSQDEQRYVTALLPLLSTPRTTKRLLNVYRLIRVSLHESELPAFEQGEHRAVLLLLAVMYGCHDVAPKFLLEIKHSPCTTMQQFIAQLKRDHGDESDDWTAFISSLASLELLQEIATYQRWVDVVRRYSFHIGESHLAP